MTEDKITITLTGRPPVRIDASKWPKLACADWSDHDGKVECQANRRWSAGIEVRRHEDGRTIVWGYASATSSFERERDRDWEGGELLPTGHWEPTCDAIRKVGEGMVHVPCIPWESLVRECIADMPAEEL